MAGVGPIGPRGQESLETTGRGLEQDNPQGYDPDGLLFTQVWNAGGEAGLGRAGVTMMKLFLGELNLRHLRNPRGK